MSKLLKGNYEVGKKKKTGKVKKVKKEYDKMFERKALEKLGGSIAFVMKSDKFVWGDDEETE